MGTGDWAGAGGVAGAKSVILGIPTVPRPQGVNYLEQTLHAVLAQVQQEVSDGPPENEEQLALCTVPYRTLPYRTVPYRTVPYRTVPYHTIPYFL